MAEEIVKSSGANDVQEKTGTAKRSNFKLMKHVLGTYRFGEYGTHYVRNTPDNGTYKIRAAHDVRSYTLQAPIMSNIQLNKDYFQIARQAILPKNWEKLYTQPSIGQDVDFETVGTYVNATKWNAFLNKINSTLITLKTYINDGSQTVTSRVTAFNNLIKVLLIGEKIFSSGSLLNALGYKAHRLWTSKKDTNSYISYDKMLESFFNASSTTARWLVNIGDSELVYAVIMNAYVGNGPETNYKEITLHELLEYARDGKNIQVLGFITVSGTVLDPTIEADQTAALGIMSNYSSKAYQNERTIALNKGIDIARLWAYQLVCAEYYTNDKVDYVYNAELYRQYINNLEKSSFGELRTFTLNGLIYEYDALSSYWFGLLTTTNAYNIYDPTVYTYFTSLFKYNRSLKYKDYFVGSKTRPLAIGSTDVAINTNTNTVSVVDISKNIQQQRFLNAVNKIGRKIEDYVKGLFGIQMKVDYHNPVWIGSTRDTIGTQETENTGAAQLSEEQSVTSVFRSNGSRYEFSVDVDRNSILIGITSFDIERCYWKGAERFFFHEDRYDWFNPYMQYTGDQEVYGEEYDLNNESDTFGYQGAYEEFKQDVNTCFGGFVENLPGWAFLDGKYENDNKPILEDDGINISPDFIRAKNSELDRFYVSLTGNTLGDYFHFIIDNYIDEDDNLPMAINPQILN